MGRTTRWLVALAITAFVGATTAATTGPTPRSAWPQPRYDAAQTAFDPLESTLSTANVSRVTLRSSVQLDNSFASGTPVVAGGVAYVETYSLNGSFARLEALRTSCRRASCPPLWTAVVGRYGGQTPTVADGMVFAGGDNERRVPNPRLFAFPADCRTDGGVCKPLWHADLPGYGQGGRGGYLTISPTVSGRVVYVESGPAFHGASLYAFSATCPGSRDHLCSPLWRGPVSVGADGNVAVADGFAYVSDYSGRVYAFRTTCRTADRVCPAVWEGNTHQLGPSGPAVADGLLFVGSQQHPGKLYAFKANGCGAAKKESCPPVWVGTTRAQIQSDPAVGYGLVVVASNDGRLYAFPESCFGACQPVWTAAYGGYDSELASPAIANGVVYVTTTGRSIAIRAFSIHCATSGALCRPLWSGTAAGNKYLFEGVVVAGGRLYATGGPTNGPARMYVFGLGHATSSPPAEPGSGRPRPLPQSSMRRPPVPLRGAITG